MYLLLFNKMQKAGQSPTQTGYNALISACGKFEQWERALSLFNKLCEEDTPQTQRSIK